MALLGKSDYTSDVLFIFDNMIIYISNVLQIGYLGGKKA